MTSEEAYHIVITNPDVFVDYNSMKSCAELIRKALMKQIPMAPIITLNGWFNEEEDWTCPNCGNEYGTPYRPSYCQECGQALNWEVSNDNLL